MAGCFDLRMESENLVGVGDKCLRSVLWLPFVKVELGLEGGVLWRFPQPPTDTLQEEINSEMGKKILHLFLQT
jgi:hypothetical protein